VIIPLSISKIRDIKIPSKWSPYTVLGSDAHFKESNRSSTKNNFSLLLHSPLINSNKFSEKVSNENVLVRDNNKTIISKSKIFRNSTDSNRSECEE
jgi:hypothetical protein